MPSDLSQPTPKRDRKVPLLVALVALYQLTKAGFFAWVFWQCWQAQGSGIPPFGEVEAHNPIFETPNFFLFALLVVFHLALSFGLLALGNWARVGCAFLLFSTIPWWFLENIAAYRSLSLPVDTSAILAAFALEAIAITIVYVTPGAREAFAAEKGNVRPL